MSLQNKIAVIFGAVGAIGTEVARIFSREGARVFLSGRHLNNVEYLVTDITGTQGDD
jgi:NADP-dependent 3-hydroxy acid dehydrogenase YdfG